MNIFDKYQHKANGNGDITQLEHFACNVFYMLKIAGFSIESIGDKVRISHDKICLIDGMTLQDTLTALIQDGINQRLKDSLYRANE